MPRLHLPSAARVGLPLRLTKKRISRLPLSSGLSKRWVVEVAFWKLGLLPSCETFNDRRQENMTGNVGPWGWIMEQHG